VPLRVLGDVGKKSDRGSWQPLSAHLSQVCQQGRIESTHDPFCAPKHSVKVCQQLFAIGTRFILSPEGGQLPCGKAIALKVGNESIGTAGYVTDMKTGGGEIMRCRPDLLGGQPLSERREILPRLLESIEDGRDERVHPRNRSAQPGLRRHLHSTHVAPIYSAQSPLAQMYGE
jgi:hypothetical protein